MLRLRPTSRLCAEGSGLFILLAALVAAVSLPAAGPAAASGSVATASPSPIVERVALASPVGLRLAGTVTSATGPVAGAVVTACPSTPPSVPVPVECKGAQTTASGTWTITGLAPGGYFVHAAPPASAGTAAAGGYLGASGYVAARAKAAVVTVAADRSGVDLALPAGSIIAGSVTSPSGFPIRDAFVEACAADVAPGLACTGAYSGADGTFSVGGLAAGSYTIGAQAPAGHGLASGYVATSGLALTAAGARRIAAGSSGVVIALPYGRSIRGTVTLEGAGAAATGEVLVQACADAACIYSPSAWTDEDGAYTLDGVGPGSYVVSFALPGTSSHVGGYRGDGGYVPSRAAAAPVSVATSSVSRVDVALPRAASRIDGIATAGGSAVRGGVVLACRSGGTCLWTRTQQRDGSFSLALPSPGPWTVALRAPGTYAAGLPLAYTAGMIVPVDPVAMDGYLGGSGFTPDASKARAVVVGSPDRIRPAITARAPRPNATGVSVATKVVVRFSEPVTGVAAKSLVLRDAATRKVVAASVTYDAATRTATLRPRVPLAKGRRYQIAVAATIADYAGNRLVPATWLFTTRR